MESITAQVGSSIVRLRMEETIRASEERFRRMFQYSAAGMVLTDTQMRFIQVNNEFCNMLMYSEPELIGKTFNEVTHPEDRKVGADLARDCWKANGKTSIWKNAICAKMSLFSGAW